MPGKKLSGLYRRYLESLNSRDWNNLGNYVAEDVSYNGQRVGYTAYLQARQDECRDIPDLYFDVQILVADEGTVACRLHFNITPSGTFLGLPVNGRRISFSENVFYEFENDKIARVWSVLDKAAIEAQLSVICVDAQR